MKAQNFILTLTALTVLLFLPAAFGLRVNTTSSMPLGFYRFTAVDGGGGSISLQYGDTAIFCLQKSEAVSLAVSRKYLGSGRCPGGLRPLIKTVAALPGDTITFTDDKIVINGKVIPTSTIQPADSHNRKMTSMLRAGTIPKGQALMLSAHNNSFDSRYFGLIPIADIQKVQPILTFN